MSSSSPHKLSTSAQSFPGKPKASSYSTQDVRNIIKKELEGKLEFDRLNVLHRLRIKGVDDELVKQIKLNLENDGDFLRSKNTLDIVRELAEGGNKSKLGNVAGDDNEGVKQRNEKKMMEPLNQIIDRILEFSVANDNGRARQYDRKWIADAENALLGEGDTDTFSFPDLRPDFTLCDEHRQVVIKGKSKWEVLWRHRAAFIEVKATAAQGPKPVKEDTVKAIVAQAADYARLHLTCRSFLLFSIGLLIFGKKFCVAIFDRDGVQFSPIYDLWDDLDTFIRIIRRMSHEMSPVDFGQDPNVDIPPLNDPNTIACRTLAINLANGDVSLVNEVSTYPTYSVNFGNIKYYTVGLPVWNSLSLLGRGTAIWRVTATPGESLATGTFLILKTAWRQSNRPSEFAIMQHVEGTHDGLVECSDGSDVFFPSLDASTPPKISTANLRNLNHHVKGDTTVLHRLIFKTVGRPIWDFNSYLEFFLAIKAALSAHSFLADQGILHRDISAGNVLLCWDPNERKDSRKGFLTDLEFAWVGDGTLGLKTQNRIPISSIPNPVQANRMTTPTTRTHTAWGPTPRGAVMTGTVQFMACELVLWCITVVNPQPLRHRVHHDVESFIWVIYYAILRRIGYVKRNIEEQRFFEKAQDDEVNNELPKDLALSSRTAFQGLFGLVDPNRILEKRYTAPPTVIMFKAETPLLHPVIQDFFGTISHYINATIRGRAANQTDFGWGTHEELHAIIDNVIAALRPTPEDGDGAADEDSDE